MVHNLYLIIVVVFRAFGLYYAGSAVLGFLVASVLTRGMGASPLMVLLVPLIGGVLLWVLAKPCATLVTKDLE